MSNKNNNNSNNTNLTDFRINKVKKIEEMYSGEASARAKLGLTHTYGSNSLTSAAAVRDALKKAISNNTTISNISKELYVVNPIYASLINYFSNMFLWRYKVIPHRVYTKSKAKSKKVVNEDDFRLIYNLMIEMVDGLSIETKFPALLSLLFTQGGAYISTVLNEESLTIDTILLPDQYCRKVGETQYGTSIIEFDFSYFSSLGLTGKDLDNYIKTFSKEFQKLYRKYQNDQNLRWQMLDPHYSTGFFLNEKAVPTYVYMYGSIIDFEKYQDNELTRNENLLKYIVSHKMPVYQDKMIFEMDEIASLHKNLRKIVDTGDYARLITTFGDVQVHKIADNENSENNILSHAYENIFSTGGLNKTLFTGESVEALKISIARDKNMVWNYVQEFLNFYTIAINNWVDFKNYQTDIDILPISSYTYHDDIKVYRENATLGVDKLGYFVASGVKQKNIQDTLELEAFLGLNNITPMQSSHTQTAEDRDSETDDSQEKDKNKDSNNSKDSSKKDKTVIEPADNKTSEEETTEEEEN